MRALGRLMLLLCFAAALAACDHRELCYDHSHWVDLTVDFDWSEAPDARPSTMVVILFPADGSEGIRYELTRTDGPSKIRVPSGYFHAVAFNGNTESLLESGSAYDKFVITTREQDILEPMNRSGAVVPNSPPRADGTEDQYVKSAPDPLWADKSENFFIIPAQPGQSITFVPRKKTVLYRVVIHNVQNFEEGMGISATLTSMAESYSPNLDAHYGADVTVPIGLGIAGDNTLSGSAEMFGHCPDSRSDRRHILTVYTSSRYYYNFDVTDQIHSGVHPTELTIEIDKLVLPKPDGGGMNPSVGDWSDVIEDLIEMQ